MAVMKMKTVNICALRNNRKRILEALQHMGVMEIKSIGDCAMEHIETAPQRAVFERSENEAKQALEILDEYAPKKGGLLSSLNGKREVSSEDMDDIVRHRDALMVLCRNIRQNKENIINAKSKIQKINTELEALEPWLECDISMGTEGTLKTDIRFGTLPSTVTEEQINKALKKLAAVYKIIAQDKNTKYLMVISVKRDTKQTEAVMRTLGFAKPAVLIRDIPSSYKNKLLEEKDRVEKAIEEYKKKIQTHSVRRNEIEAAADYYSIRAEKYRVLGGLAHSDRAFFVSGYVPERYAQGLCDYMTDRLGAACEITGCDSAPVELSNSEFASAFEPVLESYGLPKKHELDPSGIMGAFYVFLFGLMLSDAAYGLIISVVCFFALKKFKGMDRSMRSSLRMFMYCGLSTLFWGVMFGGYFGDAVTVIAKTFFNKDIEIPALWFVPLRDPMRLLMYSMLFGLIHLFTGLGIKGYMLIKQGDTKGFVFDVAAWFILLTGLLLMLMQSSIYASLAGAALELGAVGAMLARLLAAAGAIIILFYAGRNSGNFGKRLAKGAYSLYDITGWLSDLLSYSRLLALGLATGVIAQVINSMGVMAGNGIFGAIVFAVVFVVGHIFNLAINLLGAYVHTNRLQYVEFFGKFYEGGGKVCDPFRENTDYIRIREE